MLLLPLLSVMVDSTRTYLWGQHSAAAVNKPSV
jgi:hypothetical protein